MTTLTRSFAALVGALAAPALFAQGVAPAAPRETNKGFVDDAPVSLTEFVVQADSDQGYKTKNAISGTRSNVAIKDLPMSISVLNKEFIEDVGAVYASDAMKYAPSTSNPEYNPSAAIGFGQQSRGESTFRGFAALFGFRDGFRAESQSSAVNVERVEMINGPASIIYGITPPGGMFNTVTKSPVMNRSFVELYGAYDWIDGSNNHGDRSSFDVNYGRKGAPVAFRFAAGYQSQAAIQDFVSDVGMDRTYAPSVAIRPFEKTQLTVKYEQHHRRDLSGGRIAFQAGPNGASTPVQVVLYPNIPQTWSFIGPESVQVRHNNIWTATLDQKMSDRWTLQAVYNRFGAAREDVDTRQFYAPTSPLGGPAMRLNKQFVPSWVTTKNVLVSSLFKFDIPRGPGGPVRNTLIASYQRTDEYTSRIQTAVLNPNRTRVDFYAPIQVGFDLPSLWRGRAHEVESTSYGETDATVISASWQGRFANDRLLLSAAASQVDIEIQPQAYASDAIKPLFGLIYRPLPAYSIFVINSSTLFPDPRKDIDGNSFKPTSGKGWEGGVKLDAFEGRVSGTVSVFKNVNTGTILSDPNFVHPILGTRGALFQAGDTTSEGGEIDLLFSPLDNWQTLFGYGYHEVYNSKDIDRTKVGQDIPLAGPRTKISVWSKYSFRRGPLSGLSVAGGLIWHSRGLHSYVSNVPRYVPKYWDGDANVTYDFKFSRARYRLALHVGNVFGLSTQRGWRAETPGGIATRDISFPIPRTYSLSVRSYF